MIPRSRSPGSDPNEWLSREYARPHQAPRMPRNIMRNPVKVPGDGLPMETVKGQFARGGRVEGVEGDAVPAMLDNGYVIPQAGLDALRDAVNAQAEERENPREDSDQNPDQIPLCSNCGMLVPAHEPGEPCPECHGDVYDHPVG